MTTKRVASGVVGPMLAAIALTVALGQPPISEPPSVLHSAPDSALVLADGTGDVHAGSGDPGDPVH